jgi:hypothetical protein
MKIEKIHSFLTYPSKKEEKKPSIRGATVASGNKLYDMLSAVFDKSDAECAIDISFNPDDGEQKNESRTLILEYLKKPSIQNGRNIAEKLQEVTTRRSGMGLLFFIYASDENTKKLLISRFPADVGVLAEESGGALNVEFIEKVFMKSAKAYKSALYQGESFDGDFWDGRATDKQITDRDVSISDYWIKEFLRSDFRTTSAAGTRRLAVAFKNVVDQTKDFSVKKEITSATQLIKNLPQTSTSISDICSRFNFSEKTNEEIKNQLPNETLFTENFVFSSPEFTKHVHYRVVELDNGAQMIAEAAEFDEIFESKIIDTNSEKIKFVTEGIVVNEKLRKSK